MRRCIVRRDAAGVRSEPAGGPRARRAAGALAATALLLGGCATIPTSSNPTPISTVTPAPQSLRVPTPRAGMSPQEVVRDYLRANASPASRHLAARKFLSPQAAASWNDRDRTLVVDKVEVSGEPVGGDVISVRVSALRIGTLTAGGQLIPGEGAIEAPMTVRRVDGEWRIDALSDGVLVDREEFVRTYRRVEVFFVDNAGAGLVADPRWTVANVQQLPDQLMAMLLAGPSDELQGAARGLPTGSQLRGAVTIYGQYVSVDLSGLGSVDAATRTQIAAQLVWTLNAAKVGARYFVNADGAPLDPAHRLGWTTSDLAAFAPPGTSTEKPDPYVLVGGGLMTVTGNQLRGLSGDAAGARDVTSAAVAPSGTLIAAVAGGRGGSELRVGRVGGPAVTVATGQQISRPSVSARDGSVWAVVDGRLRRFGLDAGGQVSSDDEVDVAETLTRAAAEGGRPASGVREVQISPDGARVALVVDGRVMLATIQVQPRGVRLFSPRRLALPAADTVSALAWSAADTLVVVRPSLDAQVVQLPIDAWAPSALTSSNLSPPVRAVAASSRTIFVADSRGVLRLDADASDRWVEVGPALGTGAIPVGVSGG